jgi:hypothetical protein
MTESSNRTTNTTGGGSGRMVKATEALPSTSGSTASAESAGRVVVMRQITGTASLRYIPRAPKQHPSSTSS